MMLLALQVTSPKFAPGGVAVGAGVAWPAPDALSLDGGRRLLCAFTAGEAASSFKFSKKRRGLFRKSFWMNVPWHTPLSLVRTSVSLTCTSSILPVALLLQ